MYPQLKRETCSKRNYEKEEKKLRRRPRPLRPHKPDREPRKPLNERLKKSEQEQRQARETAKYDANDLYCYSLRRLGQPRARRDAGLAPNRGLA